MHLIQQTLIVKFAASFNSWAPNYRYMLHKLYVGHLLQLFCLNPSKKTNKKTGLSVLTQQGLQCITFVCAGAEKKAHFFSDALYSVSWAKFEMPLSQKYLFGRSSYKTVTQALVLQKTPQKTKLLSSPQESSVTCLPPLSVQFPLRGEKSSSWRMTPWWMNQ